MVGIICEYNPFHYGHIYHLKKVKEMFPNHPITLVLAGHFLNRGEVSVINKWDKTLLALEYGVDLVVELPFVFACQSADIYAYGAISILNHLKCEYLVFGSECNDIALLEKNAQMMENVVNTKAFMKQGLNYPSSLAKAASFSITTPNDLLAISYIKAIHSLDSSIKPICIQRTNSYHDLTLENKITSASSIRKALLENKDIHSYVPSFKYIQKISFNDYFPILKHQLLIDDITQYQGVDEKLAHSLKKNIMTCHSIEELIKKVKTKNYTYNYIQRALCHIITGFKKEEDFKVTYLRILGFNEKGRKYLNKIKKDISIPIFTTYHKKLEIELRVTKVYSFLVGEDIIEKEIKNKPIMK